MVVKNIEHLKQLFHNKNDDFVDFYVLLANGLARSCKRILYSPEFDEFSIINEIDESYQELNTSELETKTNLIHAIKAKSLYKS